MGEGRSGEGQVPAEVERNLNTTVDKLDAVAEDKASAEWTPGEGAGEVEGAAAKKTQVARATGEEEEDGGGVRREERGPGEDRRAKHNCN